MAGSLSKIRICVGKFIGRKTVQHICRCWIVWFVHNHALRPDEYVLNSRPVAIRSRLNSQMILRRFPLLLFCVQSLCARSRRRGISFGFQHTQKMGSEFYGRYCSGCIHSFACGCLFGEVSSNWGFSGRDMVVKELLQVILSIIVDPEVVDIGSIL